MAGNLEEFDPRIYGLLTLALETYDNGGGHLDVPAFEALMGGADGVTSFDELLTLLNSSLSVGVSLLVLIASMTDGKMTPADVLTYLCIPADDE